MLVTQRITPAALWVKQLSRQGTEDTWTKPMLIPRPKVVAGDEPEPLRDPTGLSIHPKQPDSDHPSLKTHQLRAEPRSRPAGAPAVPHRNPNF